MQSFIQFRKHLILEIPALDREHATLTAILNELAQIVTQTVVDAKGRRRIPELLRQLDTDTAAHFEHEEGVMEGTGYPALAEHRREHLMLHAELKAFIKDVVEGREELGLATLNALKFWLIDHILNADKVFADYYHLNHPNRHKNRASTSTGPELDSARH